MCFSFFTDKCAFSLKHLANSRNTVSRFDQTLSMWLMLGWIMKSGLFSPCSVAVNHLARYKQIPSRHYVQNSREVDLNWKRERRQREVICLNYCKLHWSCTVILLYDYHSEWACHAVQWSADPAHPACCRPSALPDQRSDNHAADTGHTSTSLKTQNDHFLFFYLF